MIKNKNLLPHLQIAFISLDRSSQDGRLEKLCASGSFISRWNIWRSSVYLARASQDWGSSDF
ncbi:hypothetical protein HanXRQr2_Chr13g0588881 [Helianthus annuus]|uniref:Uncharacterized protein n=1 Tax=Helianthus annuus TaxID=4232 RepID=A0A9K3EK36_HELAN|nr:hypothetical protein HanXRQr2_Chr13g0588881 [Helianthus annuus]